MHEIKTNETKNLKTQEHLCENYFNPIFLPIEMKIVPVMEEKNWIYLEIRPRLGSVNAYITKSKEGGKTILISNDGNLISILDKESETILQDFSWPSETYGALCPKSVHRLNFNAEEITARFKLKDSNLSLMNPR